MPDGFRQPGPMNTGGLSDPGRFFRGYIDGLITSHDGASTTDINITAGVCRDSTNSIWMELPSEITKQIDNPWAVGDDAGGYGSGAGLADEVWYHLFVIATPGGETDVGFDASITATDLLAAATGYSYYRRIGSVLHGDATTAEIDMYVQFGNRFLWQNPPLSIDVTQSDTATTRALAGFVGGDVPLGVQVMALLQVAAESSAAYEGVYVSSLSVSDESASATAAPLSTAGGRDDTGGGDASHFGYAQVLTDTSQQVRTRATTQTVIDVATMGWDDPRGRDA